MSIKTTDLMRLRQERLGSNALSISVAIVQIALLFGVGCFNLLIPTKVLGQSERDVVTKMDKKNWRLERSKLDTDYELRLKEFEQWCLANQFSAEVAEPFKRVLNRDLWRQTIFVPNENGVEPVSIDNSTVAHNKLKDINDWQAERIFSLAKDAAEGNAGGPAIQLLNEVLFFNCEHVDVRRTLGHKKSDNGWSHYPDRIAIRKGTKEHDICRWPAKAYWVVNTPNFQIESNASANQTRELAEKLERWHYVWRQVYFDYWGNAKSLRRWIAGEGAFSFSRRKFKVVFFQNKQNYMNVLVPLVPGVEISTGYYSNPKNCSFFYHADDVSAEETWKHELTHQLFRESIGFGKDLKLFENEYIWFDEGAATYAESLVDFGDYVTLGGFDARRIQYARVRLLLEGYQVPLNELNSLGRLGLQRRPDIVRLYGQIAGQFDMLMNDQAGAYEGQLISLLQTLYRGKSVRPGKFEELFGFNTDQFDQRYRQYLLVEASRIVEYLSAPLSRTELSFAKAQLNDECYPVIGRCHNLIWLDLSGNQISPQHIRHLKGCQSLQQLILTQCRLEPGTLRALTDFAQLGELDLSGSSVSDQQLLELQGQTNLKQLLLKSTHATAAGIAKLKQLLPQVEIVQ